MKLSLPAPLLGSICLEPNRWKAPAQRIPSFRVSEYSSRARAAGFGGWELFESHYFAASPAEQAALCESTFPIVIFNTYARPGTDTDAVWESVLKALRQLGPQVQAVKFNLGNESLPLDRQVRAATEWASALPAGVRMLCECHPGTLIEMPEAAAQAFAQWPAERFGAIVHPAHAEVADASAWFATLGERIQHLHWQVRYPNGGFCQLGERPDRLQEAVRTLAEAPFSGSHTLEFTGGTGKAGETPESQFQKAIADLASLRELISC